MTMKQDTFNLQKNIDRKHDKSPEYRGSINIDGQEYWLAAWINANDDGSKYFSGKVTAKDADQSPAKPLVSAKDAVGDDDIPF
jgi:uncharacterized protein (DUF736 family)